MLAEPFLATVNSKDVVTTTAEALSLDLRKCTLQDVNSYFEFTLTAREQVTALVGWFDIEFIKGVKLSTGPDTETTHWHQTVFGLHTPLSSEKNISLSLAINLDGRHLCIAIGHGEDIFNYDMTSVRGRMRTGRIRRFTWGNSCSSGIQNH
jgi:hypothetical protein